MALSLHPVAIPSSALPREASVVVPHALNTPFALWRKIRRAILFWIVCFGFGPGLVYGAVVWLQNPWQWRVTVLEYAIEVPLLGSIALLYLPRRWFRLLTRQLWQLHRGETLSVDELQQLYRTLYLLPIKIGCAAFLVGVFGYALGGVANHWLTHTTSAEVIKTILLGPIVGGLGAFVGLPIARLLRPWLAHVSLLAPESPKAVPRMTLTAKILYSALALVVMALGLFGPVAYTRSQRLLEQQLEQFAAERLAVLSDKALAWHRDPESLTEQLHTARVGKHGYIVAIAPDGQLLTRHPRGFTDLRQEEWYHARELSTWGAAGTFVERIGTTRVVAYRIFSAQGDRLIAVVDPRDFSQQLDTMLWLTWVVFFEIVLITFVLGLYFARSVTLPLVELRESTQRITQHGDLSQHVPVTSNDELGELEASFNQMVGRLRESHQRLDSYTGQLEVSTKELTTLNQEIEELLRVVSHDLRSPLINIEGFTRRLERVSHDIIDTLTALEQHIPPGSLQARCRAITHQLEDQVQKSMAFILKAVDRMDQLIAALLSIQRVGRTSDRLALNDLDAMVNDLLATFEHQLEERRITVHKTPLPKVWCHRSEVNEVFANLIANAIQYMGDAPVRRIEIGALDLPEVYQCFVRDTGMGIDPANQERVFQMFTRLVGPEIPGEGIGLSYAQRVVRNHGGEMWVHSEGSGKGSLFFFTLPRIAILSTAPAA